MKPLVTDPVIAANHPSKYLAVFGMLWVTFLLLGVFTAAKTFAIGPTIFSVGILAYPFTYIFADIFTEVYGYRVTRRIVWTGLMCLVVTSSFAYLYSVIPPSPSFADDAAFGLIFKASPGIAVANILSFFFGELTNSFVLAKMKILTRGSFLWMRLIGSTIAGQFVDNMIFYVGAFLLAGIYQPNELPTIIVTSAIFCTVWEAIASPLTQRVIAHLKRVEGLDTYDHGTNFNPFSFGRSPRGALVLPHDEDS